VNVAGCRDDGDLFWASIKCSCPFVFFVSRSFLAHRLVKNLATPTSNSELDLLAKTLVELCSYFPNKTLVAIKHLLRLEFEETAANLQGAFMRGQSLTTKIESDYCRIHRSCQSCLLLIPRFAIVQSVHILDLCRNFTY
jgi:hypothetical protein